MNKFPCTKARYDQQPKKTTKQRDATKLSLLSSIHIDERVSERRLF